MQTKDQNKRLPQPV